mgnify:CR=1 FL=1
MCGIAGWIGWDDGYKYKQPIVEKMVKTMMHRGPDAQGIWVSSHAVLGHRRLVVVDPAGGAQPMRRQHRQKSGVITYNGELYNTAELRTELQSRGYRFQSRNSDTEALLLSYLEWGPDCVKRLNGIFAFAIWDENEQTLFMARDRMGVKPLFYSQKDDQFLFASELKALLANPLIRPQVDAAGLAEILVMGPGRTPGHGIFKGILELKPGHALLYSREGSKSGSYWQLHHRAHHEDAETTAAHLRCLLEDIVERQMSADVPLCTLLSGGLDSSLITALASKHTATDLAPLHTYCVEYEQSETNLRQAEAGDAFWAEKIAGFLGTRHHKVRVHPRDLYYALYNALLATDLPGMADIDTSLMLLCTEMRQDYVVALSGECADEIFGGYPWFHHPSATGFPWMKNLEDRMATLSPEITALIKPEQYLDHRYTQALSEISLEPGEDEEDSLKKRISYLTMTRFMPTLLNRKDRMSMASGLEIRVPFSDHRLVDYVWNIPWQLKMAGGEVKGILRQAAQGLLPDGALHRIKSPYPKTEHPLYAEMVRSRMRSLLDDRSSPLLELVQKSSIKLILESQGKYFRQPWYGQLMGDVQWLAYLIQTDAWLRLYRVELQL